MQYHRQGNSECCKKLCHNCCLRAADTLKDHVQCPVQTHRPSDSQNNGIHALLPNSPSARPPLAGSTLTNVQPHQATQNDESHYAQPLPTMWQATSPAWLEAKCDASRADTAATTKTICQQTVKTVTWTEVSNFGNSDHTFNSSDHLEWKKSYCHSCICPHISPLQNR